MFHQTSCKFQWQKSSDKVPFSSSQKCFTLLCCVRLNLENWTLPLAGTNHMYQADERMGTYKASDVLATKNSIFFRWSVHFVAITNHKSLRLGPPRFQRWPCYWDLSHILNNIKSSTLSFLFLDFTTRIFMSSKLGRWHQSSQYFPILICPKWPRKGGHVRKRWDNVPGYAF